MKSEGARGHFLLQSSFFLLQSSFFLLQSSFFLYGRTATRCPSVRSVEPLRPLCWRCSGGAARCAPAAPIRGVSMEHNTSVALITGASRGLGLALATALARAGWSLIIDARDAAALEGARAA